MGSNRLKKLNELRAQAMSGDKMAQMALEKELFVPHHLRHGTKRDRILKRAGVKTERGTFITAKSHRAMPCFNAVGLDPNPRLDRLQMLENRV